MINAPRKPRAEGKPHKGAETSERVIEYSEHIVMKEILPVLRRALCPQNFIL